MFDLDASLQTATNDDPSMRGVLLLRMNRLGSGALRRTTHHHDLTWDSNTWTADALLLAVDQIPIPGRFVATNWTLTLNAADSLSQEAFERQQAEIYVAYLDEDGVVIGDALLLSKGIMNVQPLRESDGESVQPINVELFWNRGTKVRTHSRTDEGQKSRYSGDRAFRDIAKSRSDNQTIGGESVTVFR